MDSIRQTRTDATKRLRRGLAVDRRLAIGALLVGCLLLTGCHLIPAGDVDAFMTELQPRSGATPDEHALTHEIRTRTDVEDFEFAEEFDTGDPPIPGVVSRVIKVVSGH